IGHCSRQNGADLVGVTHSRISVCKAWSGQEYCGPTEACYEDHYRDNPTTAVGVEEPPCCAKDQLVVRWQRSERQKRVTSRTEEKKKAKNRTFVFSVRRPLFVPYV
ncbi:hypothetical protein T09_7593, partial [Trichinella sp. T9]